MSEPESNSVPSLYQPNLGNISEMYELHISTLEQSNRQELASADRMITALQTKVAELELVAARYSYAKKFLRVGEPDYDCMADCQCYFEDFTDTDVDAAMAKMAEAAEYHAQARAAKAASKLHTTKGLTK